MLGELSQKYPAESTENANAEEKTVSREELVKNVNKAQDAYDIAEEEYNASKTLVESYKAEMDSYAASRNGTTWHDRQDAWQKKYDEARGDWETEKGNLGGKQKNYENAKNALTEAQSVLENYKDPQEKIIAEFLLEMLNVNPDKDEKVEGDNAGFIIMREYAIDYYQRVAEFWVENPKLDIPEEMSKEYKDIAKDCSKYNEEK